MCTFLEQSCSQHKVEMANVLKFALFFPFFLVGYKIYKCHLETCCKKISHHHCFCFKIIIRTNVFINPLRKCPDSPSPPFPSSHQHSQSPNVLQGPSLQSSSSHQHSQSHITKRTILKTQAKKTTCTHTT